MYCICFSCGEQGYHSPRVYDSWSGKHQYPGHGFQQPLHAHLSSPFHTILYPRPFSTATLGPASCPAVVTTPCTMAAPLAPAFDTPFSRQSIHHYGGLKCSLELTLLLSPHEKWMEVVVVWWWEVIFYADPATKAYHGGGKKTSWPFKHEELMEQRERDEESM